MGIVRKGREGKKKEKVEKVKKIKKVRSMEGIEGIKGMKEIGKAVMHRIKNRTLESEALDKDTPGHRNVLSKRDNPPKKLKVYGYTDREIKDLEIDALPEKERKKRIKDEKTLYNIRRRTKKEKEKEGKTYKTINKKTYTPVVTHTKQEKIYKKRIKWRKEAKIKKKILNRELNIHLDNGGSLKDEKAQKILDKLNTRQNDNGTLYNKNIKRIKETPILTGTGNVPSLLDFGITYKEARFITEFVKDYDEKVAARRSKITNKHMSSIEEERVINELLGNPNVSTALQACIQDQIHRTLVTSDRTISQIAKMAFADPLEMFEDDGSGRIRDIRDIPAALRCCIAEMTHTSIYDGRGDDRVVTGHLTRVKMHDSLKALTVILKDIREKTKISGNISFNQFNNFGPGGENLKERLSSLSNEELDILVKLSNQGIEAKMIQKSLPESASNPKNFDIEDSSDSIVEMARAQNLKDGTQLYTLDALKDIEQSNL